MNHLTGILKRNHLLQKFEDPRVTATGARRASVRMNALYTLWFNTGTLCNLTCGSCFIESSPTNDRLVYLSAAEVKVFLDEIERDGHPTQEVGFTGGEPFMNPEIVDMLEAALHRRPTVVVLTNAMKPMMKCAEELGRLNKEHPGQLIIRVSVDHYTRVRHEQERGQRSWPPMLKGLRWLAKNDFSVRIAGRTCWKESESDLRSGYSQLFAKIGLSLDAFNPEHLILFPDMDIRHEAPEVTEECWGILGVRPDSVMCATSRMVVKRKNASAPMVVSCTLLPYDSQFELGRTLAEAACEVSLNHPFCAQFCVLGGGSCGTDQGCQSS